MQDRFRIQSTRRFSQNLKRCCVASHAFDDNKETFLFTDARPHGIEAILMPKSAGQNNAKIITTHRHPFRLCLSDRVWQTVSIDYLGPLQNGYYIFITIDQRSRYPDF